MKKYFITATGTDIGKTYLTTSLNMSLINRYNKRTFTLKPIISGFDKLNLRNDTALIINSMNLDYNDKNINKISPFRLKFPLSPDMAAKKEKKTLEYKDILGFCKKSIDEQYNNNCDYLLIEGVGGVMSPVCEAKTNLDLIADLDISVILVVGSYVGSVSHSLTAIKAVEEKKLKISSIIISESYESKATIEDTAKSLNSFIDNKILSLSRNDLYKNMEKVKIIAGIL